MLEVWSLEHREAQHSQDSLDVLAAKYTADLIEGGVDLETLIFSCRASSRRWRFFPKMADILDAIDAYRQSQQLLEMRRMEEAFLAIDASRNGKNPWEIAMENREALTNGKEKNDGPTRH